MNLAVFIRALTVTLTVLSIAVTFYVMIILQDYEIISNPEGPETEDYFEAWHNQQNI